MSRILTALVLLALLNACGSNGAGSIEPPQADSELELIAALLQDAVDEIDLPPDTLELDPASGRPDYCTTDVEEGPATIIIVVRVRTEADVVTRAIEDLTTRWEAFGYDVEPPTELGTVRAFATDQISIQVSPDDDGGGLAISSRTACLEFEDGMFLGAVADNPDPLERLDMLGIEPPTRQIETFD